MEPDKKQTVLFFFFFFSCVADNVAIPDQNYMNDLQDTFQQMSEQITKNDLIPGLNSAEFDDVLPSTANDVGAGKLLDLQNMICLEKKTNKNVGNNL